MQLAALLASPQGVLQCGFCQRLFQPTRKPRTDRSYNRTCGRDECKRLAHNRIQNE